MTGLQMYDKFSFGTLWRFGIGNWELVPQFKTAFTTNMSDILVLKLADLSLKALNLIPNY